MPGTGLIERPIISYAIILLLSLLAAVLCFQIGGSVAEIADPKGSLLGLSIKAGGGIAGFVIIFLLSIAVVERLRRITPAENRLLREYLLRTPEVGLDPTDQSLSCSYSLYDQENGGWGEWKNISYVREGLGFRILVHEMRPHHVIRVKLVDSRTNVWQSVEDHPYGVSAIHMKRV